MKDQNLTPPAPLVRGEYNTGSTDAPTPSLEKGRAGEGLRFLPYDKRLTALARENRNNPTPAEILLWQKVLRGKQFGQYKFLRQKPIGQYIVDFYCAELHLVIEIDGDSHAEQLAYDEARTNFLKKLGLNVIRYTNRDVLNNLPGVYQHLQTKIETP